MKLSLNRMKLGVWSLLMFVVFAGVGLAQSVEPQLNTERETLLTLTVTNDRGAYAQGVEA